MAFDLKAICGAMFIDPETVSAKDSFVFAEYKPETQAQDNTARAKIAVNSNRLGLSVWFAKHGGSVFVGADCLDVQRAGAFMERLKAIAPDTAFHKIF